MTEVFAKESVLQNTSTDVVYSYSFSILISCQFYADLARLFYIFPNIGARKLFCILLVICVSFNNLFLPKPFFPASFLELLEQSLAVILAHQRPLVVNRKAADLAALRRCFWMPMQRASSEAEANCPVPSSCSSIRALAMRMARLVGHIV